MLQWIAKFKHTIVDGKKATKKQEVVLLQAVNYTDVEIAMTKFLDEEGFVNPTSPDISKFQAHEILGYSADTIKQFFKWRIKYTTEADGKISIFYSRYLVHADDMEKALKIVKEKEKGSAIQGEMEGANITKIDYMLIPIE